MAYCTCIILYNTVYSISLISISRKLFLDRNVVDSIVAAFESTARQHFGAIPGAG